MLMAVFVLMFIFMFQNSILSFMHCLCFKIVYENEVTGYKVKHVQRLCSGVWRLKEDTLIDPPEGRPGGFLMFPPPPLSGILGLSVWSHFSITPLLFFCLVLLHFLSYPLLLLAHSPDLFPPKPTFSERQAVLCGSGFCLFGFLAVRRWVS